MAFFAKLVNMRTAVREYEDSTCQPVSVSLSTYLTSGAASEISHLLTQTRIMQEASERIKVA